MTDPSAPDLENVYYNKIYPDINEIKHQFENNRDNNPFIDQLEKIKIENFMNEKKVLEDLLKHYKKLKFKYTKIDSSLKLGCVLITGVTTIGSAILTGIPTLGASLLIYVPVGISVFTALNLFVGESISLGFTSKKKKVYREICESIEHSIDKLYLFQMKALEDKILTNEEIEQAKIIINECKENINKIKNGQIIENLNKEVKKELKEEIKKEYKEKLKNL